MVLIKSKKGYFMGPMHETKPRLIEVIDYDSGHWNDARNIAKKHGFLIQESNGRTSHEISHLRGFFSNDFAEDLREVEEKLFVLLAELSRIGFPFHIGLGRFNSEKYSDKHLWELSLEPLESN